VERIVIQEYKDETGNKVPAHYVRQLTAEETKERAQLNFDNTSATLRRKVLAYNNGHAPSGAVTH
jgi:hypothetical protein